MWGSGQEIVSRVRATGVKQGNRKLFFSLFFCRESKIFDQFFCVMQIQEKGIYNFFFFREDRILDK